MGLRSDICPTALKLIVGWASLWLGEAAMGTLGARVPLLASADQKAYFLLSRMYFSSFFLSE
jgi:hypothetical protein